MAETFDHEDPAVSEHNERMAREAEREWAGQNGRGRVTRQELAVREAVHAPPALAHPLERDPVEFKRALEVRKENRATFIEWIRDSLKRDVDFGKIHYVAKTKCADGAACKNPRHFTKDVLFKPGAEKICGMLDVVATYPNLHELEGAIMEGRTPVSILVRCAIVSRGGVVVSEGVGARNLGSDYGDLNKSLKMAKKSAHIDAVLALAGLSEIFTHQDRDERDDTKVPSGKYEGRLWTDVPVEYLQAVIASNKAPADVKAGARAELGRRPQRPPTEDFDDEIPF